MLAIRMQRTGRTGHAQFRVIVQDSRFSPTRGRVVAYAGSYDPHTKVASLDTGIISSYMDKGAQPSDRVARLLKKEGVKLPKWVALAEPKKRAIKNPDKLRRNRPPEAKTTEPTAQQPEAETAESAEAPVMESSEAETADAQVAEAPVAENPSEATMEEAKAAEPEVAEETATQEPAAEADKPADKAENDAPKS